MSFFDKAKAAASQAAAKAKQGAEDLQLKVDLGSAYDDLGKAAFELIEQGEIAHEKLDAPAAKVRELRQRMEGEAKPADAASADAAAATATADEIAADAPGEPEGLATTETVVSDAPDAPSASDGPASASADTSTR